MKIFTLAGTTKFFKTPDTVSPLRKVLGPLSERCYDDFYVHVYDDRDLNHNGAKGTTACVIIDPASYIFEDTKPIGFKSNMRCIFDTLRSMGYDGKIAFNLMKNEFVLPFKDISEIPEFSSMRR
jgi:hypothetical protein